jgi:hypothetical protein
MSEDSDGDIGSLEEKVSILIPRISKRWLGILCWSPESRANSSACCPTAYHSPMFLTSCKGGWTIGRSLNTKCPTSNPFFSVTSHFNGGLYTCNSLRRRLHLSKNRWVCKDIISFAHRPMLQTNANPVHVSHWCEEHYSPHPRHVIPFLLFPFMTLTLYSTTPRCHLSLEHGDRKWAPG